MKKQAVISAMVLAFTAGAFAQGKHEHAHEHAPLHGGVVVESKDVDYELVATPDTLQLHLRDHGKPMDVSKASARVTLLAGAEKQDVELKPAGGKLEAKGSFKVPAGTKAIAVVSNAGKTLGTARFVLK